MAGQNWNKSTYSRSSRANRFGTFSRFSRSQIYQQYRNYNFPTFRQYCAYCKTFHVYFTIPGDHSTKWYILRYIVFILLTYSKTLFFINWTIGGTIISHEEGGGDSISCYFLWHCSFLVNYLDWTALDWFFCTSSEQSTNISTLYWCVILSVSKLSRVSNCLYPSHR